MNLLKGLIRCRGWSSGAGHGVFGSGRKTPHHCFFPRGYSFLCSIFATTRDHSCLSTPALSSPVAASYSFSDYFQSQSTGFCLSNPIMSGPSVEEDEGEKSLWLWLQKWSLTWTIQTAGLCWCGKTRFL